MGGRTAGARDRMMERLIADHIAEASTGPYRDDGRRQRASAANAAPPVLTAGPRSARLTSPMRAAARSRPDPEPRGEGDNTDEEDDDAAPPRPAVVTPPRSRSIRRRNIRRVGAPRGSVAARPRLGQGPRRRASAATTRPQVAAKAPAVAATVPARRRRQEARRRGDADRPRGRRSRRPRPEPAGSSRSAPPTPPTKRNDLLIRARAQNRSTLASAKAFTEKVKKGEGVLYRARFAGLDSASAGQACRSLKRSGFSCFATHD